MSERIQIAVNGVMESIDCGISINSLLKSKSIESTKVVIEINQNIIKRDSFDAYHFKNGDCVEILRFVGGG
jgi:sulfur carrier protein